MTMQTIAGTVVKSGVIALALALSGCGGGGGNAPVADPPVAQRAVQGTAAKGLIKGARVNVHALDAQGVRAGTALASATTGADGTYLLQVPASIRNFVLEVSAVPGAVMADEATGADLALPDGMKLRSVVMLAENATGTYEGSISPLTEMIARTAETADGKLPQQAVAQAKISVRTLFGFDPETVKPVNSNSPAAASASEDEKNQSLALAAISKLASTPSANCGQSTPSERIACVVGKLAGSVVVKDGQPTLEQHHLEQLRDAIQKVAEDKTINRTGKGKVVGIPVLTPAPTPVTPPPAGTTRTPLEATKALFGSLRTNLRALSEGDVFGPTANAIKADLDGAVAPLGNDVAGFASLAVDALTHFDRYRTGTSSREDFLVIRNKLMDADSSPSLSYLDYGNGSCVIKTSPLSMSCTVVEDAFLPGTIMSFTSGTRVYMSRTFTLQPQPGSTRDFTYTAFREKNVVAYQGHDVVGTPTRERVSDIFSGAMTFRCSRETITELGIDGRLPGRIRNNVVQSDYEDWLLNVVRTEEADGAVLYAFGGAFTATLAGQSAGKIAIDDTSFLRVVLGANGNVLPNTASELRLTLRGIVGSTTVGGTLRVSGDTQDKSGTTHVPARVSFDGALEHGDATVFSGNIDITRNGYENYDATLAESDTNFVKDSVEIGGSLSLPNRPALSLTLGLTRSAKDTGNLSAQYRDGNAVINASVTARAGERHPLVKVSSADGVAFSFTSNSVPVQVTKDGALTALLDLSKGIVSYSDGSTESLK
jgi:hypothetical protein